MCALLQTCLPEHALDLFDELTQCKDYSGLLCSKAWSCTKCGQPVALNVSSQPNQSVHGDVQVKSTEKVLPASHKDSQLVERIGRRIVDVLPTEDGSVRGYTGHLRRYKWEFATVKSDQVNAFVAPGGKVVVYTGVLATLHFCARSEATTPRARDLPEGLHQTPCCREVDCTSNLASLVCFLQNALQKVHPQASWLAAHLACYNACRRRTLGIGACRAT